MPMIVNTSSLEEENQLDNERIKSLVSHMKLLFPGGSEQLILEVIYENHGKYDRIVHELTERFGQPRHSQSLNTAVPYPPTSMRLPYERSASDVTGLSDATRFQSHCRPMNIDMSHAHILQHIARQRETYARMHEKVLELRKDSARFREDIRRAEDELITRAKVQKNPTEKDVEKLKKEIAILTNEVQEENNKLERARGDIPSVGNSPRQPRSPPPTRFHNPESPQQIRYAHNNVASFPVHCPPSGPRFPVTNIPNHTNAPSVIFQPTDGENLSGVWSCPRCTYINHPDLQKCEMCFYEGSS